MQIVAMTSLDDQVIHSIVCSIPRNTGRALERLASNSAAFVDHQGSVANARIGLLALV